LNKVYVLGIGPGNGDYLLKKSEKIIYQMDVLIGGQRALDLFPDLEVKKVKIKTPLADIKNYILKNYQNQKIAVLVSGDPGLYSLLNYLRRELDARILEVIPGISALQLAAAKIKINWNDLQITSLHGKDNKAQLLKLLQENNKVGFFTDNKFPPNKIAEYLLENGIKDQEIFVFENLSYQSEKITAGRAEKIAQNKFSKLTVMIILAQNERDYKLDLEGDFNGRMEI
jgi:cobalt-precorrin-7 (C5)-methyltransferase